MGTKVEAKVSHHFKATAEQVYDAWLDPAKVRVWMSAALKTFGLSGDIQQVVVDARIGGKFLFSDMRNGTEQRHWGTYLELDRPHKIVFTWIVSESEEADPSKVTLTIQPDGTGCTATLVHEMDEKWIDFVSRTEDGWLRMIQQIDRLVG